jgi:hypothetical protein
MKKEMKMFLDIKKHSNYTRLLEYKTSMLRQWDYLQKKN